MSPPISVQESIKIFGVINKQGEGVEISSERECGGLEKNSKINIRGGAGEVGRGEGNVYLALKSTTNDVTYYFLCKLLETDPSREICTYTT